MHVAFHERSSNMDKPSKGHLSPLIPGCGGPLLPLFGFDRCYRVWAMVYGTSLGAWHDERVHAAFSLLRSIDPDRVMVVFADTPVSWPMHHTNL